MKGLLDLELFLSKGQKQESTNCYPNLRIDCVLRGTIERPDMEMLLDPFGEEFNVPTLAVEFCDGEGLVSHVVGQESVDLSVGKVLIGNQPEFFRITPGGLVGCQFNDFIGHDTGVLVDWAGIEDVVFDVVLGPRNEEGAVPVNAVEQAEEVNISLVQQIDCTHLNAEVIQHLDIVYGRLRKMNEHREIAAQIELSVHLDTGLCLPELGPGAEAETETETETETDRAAVKSIDGVVQVEPERVVRIQGTDFVDEDLVQVGIDAPVAEFVGPRQCIAGNGIADPVHVQLMGDCRQVRFDVPKASLVRILGQTYHKKLVVAGKVPDAIVPVV